MGGGPAPIIVGTLGRPSVTRRVSCSLKRTSSSRRMKGSLAFLLAFVSIATASCARGWRTYRSEVDGFSIAFPCRPSQVRVGRMDIDTLFGSTAMTIYSRDAGSQAYFVAQYRLPGNPDADLAALLDAERDRGLENTHCSLVSDNAFHSNGREGREIVADHSGGKQRVRCRNFILGDRLYSLIVVGPKDHDTDVACTKFFASFSSP